jgi:hypothetical protein
MGKAARAAHLQHFEIGKVAEQYHAVYTGGNSRSWKAESRNFET